jgi:flagellin-like hook-associated protein FlgL
MIPIATRVGTYAQRTSLVQQMTTIQSRMYEAQVQVATEKKSQNYTGISRESFRLVNLETQRTEVSYFMKSNAVAQVRLDTMNTSVEAIEERLHEVRDQMNFLNFGSLSQPLNEDEKLTIKEIQAYAFAAMQDMAYYLNAQADGRYVFAGGRTDEPPVNFPYGTLEQFQADYDGAQVKFPTTRAANVPDIKITQAQHGGLTFATNEIAPAVGSEASTEALVPGTVIELSDADMTTTRFMVVERDAGTGALRVSPDPGPNGLNLTNALQGDATIKGVTYYQGDSLEYEHRVSDNRAIQLGVNAKDPAFEKAFRALGILAQGGLDNDESQTLSSDDTGDLTFAAGPPGTVTATTADAFDGLPLGSTVTFNTGAGLNDKPTFSFTIIRNDGDVLELDPPPAAENFIAPGVPIDDVVTVDIDNLARLREAITLLNDAIDHDRTLTSEESGDIGEVARLIGFNQVTLDRTIEDDKTFDGYLEMQQIELENVSLMDAATRLNDEANALEASMATYARISGISLMNYL